MYSSSLQKIWFYLIILCVSADFGDFNRYDSQEFLQKFVLFPIVSSFIYFWLCSSKLMFSVMCSWMHNVICVSPSLYRDGSRMKEYWKRPLRRWLCFTRTTGEKPSDVHLPDFFFFSIRGKEDMPFILHTTPPFISSEADIHSAFNWFQVPYMHWAVHGASLLSVPS